MELTKKSLLKHCRAMNLYSTPELNEKLYLHQKGICKIENLEEYVGVKVLWLQTNGIQVIENLNNLTELRHLYLNENLIKRLDGEQAFHGLGNLDTLNLEKNYIATIAESDLCMLSKLNTLNVAHNRLHSVDALRGLLSCPALSVLDLRNNGIEIDACLIDDILSKLPHLRVLYLISTENQTAKNVISDELQCYRKTLVAKCNNLRHLDDRPVFDDERRCCDQWLIGGIEAERAERQKIRNEAAAKRQANHEAFAKLVNDGNRNAAKLDAESDDDDSKR